MALSIGELVGYVGLDTEAAESAADRLGGIFGKLGGAWGGILAGAGAAAGAAGIAGLLSGMDSEVATDKLAASLGGGEKMAARYGHLAGQVYSDGFGEGTEDVAAAIGAVVTSIKGMRNASDSEVQAMTEKAMTYADVMGIDVTRAAQVAGNMVANGMAKNGAQAFDLLMAASQKVPVQLREDVLDATDEYGQFFTAVGIDGPKAMGMLAAGAAKGMYGIDKTGDAIKEFSIRATDMSATSKAAYKTIGLDAGKMADDLLAGGERGSKAFDQVVSGLLKIKDPAKRANTSIALFGTPLEDIGTKDIPTFLKSLQNGEKGLGKFKGSVDKAGKTAYDNASSNLSVFVRTIKTGFVELIGGSVLPVVNDLTGKLANGLGPAMGVVADATGDVVGFLKEHKTTAQALAVVIGALMAVTIAHSAVLAVGAAGGMAAWLRGTKLISAATKVWAAVQWAMNAAMTANPIGLIIVAIVALVAAVVIAYKKSETFRNIVNGAFSGVAKVAGKVLDWLTKAVGRVIDFVRDHWRLLVSILGGPIVAAALLIQKHWDKIVSGAKAAWSLVKSLVATYLRLIVAQFQLLASLPGRVADLFARIKDAAVNKLTDLVGWVRGLPGKIKSAIGNVGRTLWDAGVSIIQGLIDGVMSKVGELEDKFHSITDKIPDWKGPAETDRKLLRKNGQLIMRGLMDGISDGTRGVKALLRKVTDDLSTKDMSQVERAVRNEYAAGLRIAAQREKVAKALASAKQKLQDAVQLRNDFRNSVMSGVLDFGSVANTGGTATDMVAQLQSKLDAAKAFRQNLHKLLGMGLSRSAYRDIVDEGVEAGGAIAESLVAGGPDAVHQVSQLSHKMADEAKRLAKETSKHLYQAGVDSASALVDGLQAKSARLHKAAEHIAKVLAREVSRALGVAIQNAGHGGHGGGHRTAQRATANAHANHRQRDHRATERHTVVDRRGPLIGNVTQQKGESAEVLAERLWFKTRTRG